MPSPNIVAASDAGPIIINVNDRFIGQSILRTGGWEKNEIKLITQLLEHQLKSKERLLVYDVGANIGTHTLSLAKYFGDRIRIRAFEAQRPIFNMLNGTLALNGLLTVMTHNVAVSDQSGATLEITLPDYTAANNFGGLELIKPQRSDNQSMTRSITEIVKTIMLDDFGETVDFIKMDIEGMEDKALRGAVGLFDRFTPLAFIEILKTDRSFIFDFFKSRSYKGYGIGGNLLAIPETATIHLKDVQTLF